MIKKLLENHIKENIPDEEVAVLLGGGVDAISIALTAHDCGKKVKAYSFYLEEFKVNDKTYGGESYDYLKAKSVAEIMGWEFVGVKVPRNNLVKDWHRLVKLKCRKKTHFECVFPFLYVYPKIKETHVLTGWGADGYFGVSKKAMMRFSNDKKWDNYTNYCKKHNQKQLTFDEFRNAYLDGDCAGLKEHTNIADNHNKKHITPYLDSEVRKNLMSKSWKELNKPTQKYYIRKDFTELKKFGIIKPHLNLHLGAGIQYLFETLLNNKEINFKGRKRMMDVCRDWYKKE